MDDILFGNNNQATINRLAKRSYRANKQRNVFVTIALFLTAFMITSVFSLGCSYFETYQMQQIRAMGTTADVAITSLSEEQYGLFADMQRLCHLLHGEMQPLLTEQLHGLRAHQRIELFLHKRPPCGNRICFSGFHSSAETESNQAVSAFSALCRRTAKKSQQNDNKNIL